MERETLRQIRSIESKFNTRDDDGALHIEGYFAVFNSVYQIWDDMSESVAPGAFTDALGGDVRALIDHETRLVLGRNTAGTLQLREDSHGLWGDILINPDDQDAMNLYARVQRGDVNQCSFGFDILEEETEFLPDGSVHWTIKKVKLYEVSVCTFPAYSETTAMARKNEYDEIMKRKADAWRAEMTAKLKGVM